MNAKLDRRKKYTRMVLKESLIHLLKEKPIASISVKEVCSAADINRSTFYAHYMDLYDLLHQIEEEIVRNIKEVITTYVPFDNDELLEMFEKLLLYIAENSDSCQTLFSENGSPAFQKKVMMLAHECTLEQWEHHDALGPDYLEYLSIFVVNGSISLIQTWLKKGMKQSPRQMAKLMNHLTTEGIESFVKQQ